MAGGQQINSGQGTLTADSPESEALAGSEATAAAGSHGNTRLHPLRSRKVGGGQATHAISGQLLTSAFGLFTPTPIKTPTGQVASLLGGSLGRERTAALTGANANAAAGSVSAPLVATGLWATPYSYTTSQWQLTNRAGTSIPAPSTGTNIADFIGSYRLSKHTQSFLRRDGRVWHGLGDAEAFPRVNVDGYDDINGGSNQPTIYSFDQSNPLVVKREIGSYPNFNSSNYNVIWTCADEGFMVYDPGTSTSDDAAWIKPLRSDGYEQFPTSDEAEVPSYVSSNVIRFSGDQRAKYATGKALIVYLNHSVAGANTPKRGRITASTLNGGNTDVTLGWFDAFPAMSASNPPTGVRKQNELSSRVGGGWEASESYALPRYNDVTGKWLNTLVKLTLSTRVMEEVYFETTSRDMAMLAPKNAVFVPASVAGTGHPEIHCFGFDASGNGNVQVYDLTARTLTVHPIITPLNNSAMWQPQAAFDGTRYAYVCQWHHGRIMKWDCTNKVEVWAKPVTIGGKYLFNQDAVIDPETGQPDGSGTLYGEPVFAPLNSSIARPIFSQDLLQLAWNAEINRLELYRPMEGFGDVFLIDPSKTALTGESGAVEFIANRDDDTLHLNGGWNVQHLPTNGATPARTLLMGGLTFDQGRAPHPDKLRVFVGANRREWQDLSNGGHFFRVSGPPGSPHQTDNNAVASNVTTGMYPIWGSLVAAVNSAGLETGILYSRAGGDGDYAGNGVVFYNCASISGTTVPVQLNLATNSTTAAQWNNKIHSCPRRNLDGSSGGTTAQRDVMVNPADLTQWQPSAIHGYHRVGFHPSVGYIEDHFGPSLPLTTENNPYPGPDTNGDRIGEYPNYPGQVDLTWFGPESKGIVGGADGIASSAQLADGTRGIISWKESGINAGLWRKRTINPVPGGQPEWRSQLIGDYNGSTGKTLHCFEDANTLRVYEWDGSAGTFTFVRNVTATGGGAIIGEYGNQTGDCFWLEGNKYIFFYNADNFSGARYSLWEGGATATPFEGANGNSIISSAIGGNRPVYLAVDRTRRELIWMVTPAGTSGSVFSSALLFPFRLYRSSFDSPMSLTAMYVKGGPMTTHHYSPNTGGSVSVRFSAVYNGYLYVMRPTAGYSTAWGHSGGALSRLPLY